MVSRETPLGGYRPGRSFEHEPMDRAERLAQHTAKDAAKVASHIEAGNSIRSALRG